MLNIKLNKWTFFGSILGLGLSSAAALPIFGLVFGGLFFTINAILFGFRLINNPITEEFFYAGLGAACITVAAGVIAGAYSGTKYGNK